MSNSAQIIQLSGATDSVRFQPTFQSSSERKTIFRVEETYEKSQSASSETKNESNEAATNNFSQPRHPLVLEQQFFDELLKRNEETRNQLIDKFASKLIERMRFFNYDQDSEDIVWPIVDTISAISLSVLGATFHRICVQKYDSPNILCAVAKCLCSFDLTQTAEWGPMILISLLSHKNETVKEYAVILLENWADRSLLPILKNLDCQASWLREYVNSVICNLEG